MNPRMNHGAIEFAIVRQRVHRVDGKRSLCGVSTGCATLLTRYQLRAWEDELGCTYCFRPGEFAMEIARSKVPFHGSH